ncbi:MAG: tetratricopeptide repeat protein, partial [Planctomycetota bacterium]
LANYYDRDIRALEARLSHDPKAIGKKLQQEVSRQKSIRDDLLRKSIPIWQAVLTVSKDNPYALAGLSKAYLVTGQTDTGIYYAERYVELSRKSQKGWREKLKEWEKMMGREVTTEQRDFYLKKIHGAREKEIGMLLLLGATHMRREEFSKAVENYDSVLTLDPARVAALVERAQGYAALAMYDQAVKDLEKYLKLTDPRKHREARISAADLLDRYQRLAGRQSIRPAFPPAAPRAPAVAPPPAPAPAPTTASGSPDG